MRWLGWSMLALALAGCPQDDILDRDGDGQRPRAAGGTDCDDSDPTVYLGADERCGNGRDDDCDNDVDEDGVGSRPFFQDADRDGYGAPNSQTLRCELADGFAENDQDCDDTDSDYNPDALDDECDGRDQNCNDVADDGAEVLDWYPDADGDGYGAVDGTVEPSCELERPGYARQQGDCNDADDQVHPGAAERCNGLDDDCDDDVDGPVIGNGAACPASTCLEVHERNDQPAIGSFWVTDSRPGGDVARVECASVAGVGDGWMHVTLDWVREDDAGSFDKGGSIGGFVGWVDRGGEQVPLLDPEFRCARPMRWTRFQVDLPVSFTRVYGDWTLYADDVGRAGVPWGGVDNAFREFGGISRTNEACGNGAVLFGAGDTVMKYGGDWPADVWAPVDARCRDAADSRCRSWQTDGVDAAARTSTLLWELHGTRDGYNSAATVRSVDLYVQ